MAFQSSLTAVVNIPQIELPYDQAWSWNLTVEKDKEGTLIAGDTFNGSIFIGFYNGGKPTIQTDDGQLTLTGDYEIGGIYSFNISSDGLGTLTLSVGDVSGTLPLTKVIPVNLFLKYKQNRADFKFTGVAYGKWTFTGIPGGDRSYDWDQPVGTGILPDTISGYDGIIENVGLGGFIVSADTTKPTIVLLGDNPLTIIQGEPFSDPAFIANDNVDGNLDSQVVITGEVDTSTIGTYVLTYSVTDSAGNTSDEVSRVVNVIEDPDQIDITGGVTVSVKTTQGGGFSNCVINSSGASFKLPVKLNQCSVFANSDESVWDGSGEFIATNTSIANNLSGACFSESSVQLGTASTDLTARTYKGIILSDNFKGLDFGDFRVLSSGLIGNYSIGAFILSEVLESPFKVKQLMAGVANTISRIVGDDLSEIGAEPYTLPSVFIINSKPLKPLMPYATVAHRKTEGLGLNTRDSYIADDGELVNVFSKEVVLRINFHGGVDDDTDNIAGKYSDFIDMQIGRDIFDELVGHPLIDSTDVSTNSFTLSNAFEEVSSLDLRLAVTVLYKESNLGFIEIINTNGRVEDINKTNEINVKTNLN